MKKLLCVGALALFSSCVFGANHEIFDPKKSKDKIVIKMKMLETNKKVGEIVAVQTPYGVAFYPNLNGLSGGLHGFHIHENPSCGATAKGLGMKAGGHWDPHNTTRHSFAWDDNGHKGDLPAIYVTHDGVATNPVLAPKIKSLDEIRKHSLMIHIGGDNHSDHPAPLGGGGGRMVCGVIK